ncbi:MAG: hypothetical protein R3C01_18040 [Planctomycetaceae bacterium]
MFEILGAIPYSRHCHPAYRDDNLLSTIDTMGITACDFAYTWDANKNKTSEVIYGPMAQFGFTALGATYDDADRLTGWQRADGNLNQSWKVGTCHSLAIGTRSRKMAHWRIGRMRFSCGGPIAALREITVGSDWKS